MWQTRVIHQVLLALLVLAWRAAPAHAAFEFKDAGWEGASELYEMAKEQLGPERVKLVASLDFSVLKPTDGVLVLHPRTRIDDRELAAFVREGGRVAVLDDYGEANSLLERFRIRRIRAPKRPLNTLRNNHWLAVAVPATEQAAGIEQGRHPIVAGVTQVITNHATALDHPELTPVLKIEAVGEPDATVAVTGIIKRGRLFAMSDPSTLINLMLRYPGNRAFADGLIRYLLEDDSWGKRQGKLYLLANKFGQTGHYGAETDVRGHVLATLRELSERLRGIHDEGLPIGVVTLLAALLVVASAGWVLWVGSRTYRRTGPSFAQAVPLVAQGGAAGWAAVLSSPTTAPALVVAELKSALEEGLAERLGLPHGAHRGRILEEIEARGALDPASRGELNRVFEAMAVAEASIAAGHPAKVRRGHVQELNRKVKVLLNEVGEYPRKHP